MKRKCGHTTTKPDKNCSHCKQCIRTNINYNKEKNKEHLNRVESLPEYAYKIFKMFVEGKEKT